MKRLAELEKLKFNGTTLIYNGRSIQVAKEGKYLGADGNFWPFAPVSCEGAGVKEVWEILKSMGGEKVEN